MNFDAMLQHIQSMPSNKAVDKLKELCDSYDGVDVPQKERIQRVFLLSEVSQGHVTKFKFEKKTSWFSFNRFQIRWKSGTHKNEEYNFRDNAKLLNALVAKVNPDTLDEAQLKKFNKVIRDYNEIIESVAQKKEPGFFSKLFGRAEKKRKECKEIRDQKIGELTKKINVPSQVQQPVQEQRKQTLQAPPKPPTDIPRKQTPFSMPQAAESVQQEIPQAATRKQTVPAPQEEERPPSKTVVQDPEARKKTIVQEAQPQKSAQTQMEEASRKSIVRKHTAGVLISQARASSTEGISKEQKHLLDILKGISENVSSWQKAMKGFSNTTEDIIQLKEEFDLFAKDCDIFLLEDPLNNQAGILHLQQTFKKFEDGLSARIQGLIEKLLGEIQKNKQLDSKPLEGQIRNLLNKIGETDLKTALASTISFWKEFNNLNAKSGQRERLKIEEYFIYTVLNAVHRLYDLESIYSTENYEEAVQKLTSLQKKGRNESQYQEYLDDLHSLQEDVLHRIGIAARKRQQWLSSIQNEPFNAMAMKISEQLKGAQVKGSIDRNSLHDTIQEKFEIFLNASAQFEGLVKKLEAIEEHNIQQKIDMLLKEVEDPKLYPFQLDVNRVRDLSERLNTFKEEFVSNIDRVTKTKDPEEREEELRDFDNRYKEFYDDYEKIVRESLKGHFDTLKAKIPKGEGQAELFAEIERIKIRLNKELSDEDIDRFLQIKGALDTLKNK